jgi:hypothetical protein
MHLQHVWVEHMVRNNTQEVPLLRFPLYLSFAHQSPYAALLENVSFLMAQSLQLSRSFCISSAPCSFVVRQGLSHVFVRRVRKEQPKSRLNLLRSLMLSSNPFRRKLISYDRRWCPRTDFLPSIFIPVNNVAFWQVALFSCALRNGLEDAW